MGQHNMFPLYTSNEYPYIQIGALISIALGSIQGLPPPITDLLASLLGRNPSTMFAVHPYAMTNPIWVDYNGNGGYDVVNPQPPLPYTESTHPDEVLDAAQLIRAIPDHPWAVQKAVLKRAPLC
jgi:hypothetical protein